MGATSKRLTAAAFLLGLLACSKEPPSAVAVAAATTAPAPSPTVHFDDLRAHLPAELKGYRLSSDEGSTGRYGEVSISEAERVFVHPDGHEVKVRIVDTTMSTRIGDVIKAAADDAIHKGATDPTAPLAGLTGTVGFVRYDAEDAKAEANLLVGDRFVVAVTSWGLESTSEVRRIARSVDLAGLASLR